MKIIYSNIIPFKGYVAINLFGVLFARNEYKGHISDVVINHEEIHTEQMRELLYIGFYLWYVIEWLIKLPFHKNAYRAISFEREAYAHQTKTPEGMYIYRKVVRKRFAFLKYL